MSEKTFPLNLQKYRNLNLIKHSGFLILHIQFYKQLLRVDRDNFGKKLYRRSVWK